MKHKKKTGYVCYDYEAAYVDEIREKEIERERQKLPSGSVYALSLLPLYASASSLSLSLPARIAARSGA